MPGKVILSRCLPREGTEENQKGVEEEERRGVVIPNAHPHLPKVNYNWEHQGGGNKGDNLGVLVEV